MTIRASMVITVEELARESEEGQRGLSGLAPKPGRQASRPVARQQPAPIRLMPRQGFPGEDRWRSPRRAAPLNSEAEINALYREARRLIPLAATDPQAEATYQKTMQRLRELQQCEADKWAARFDANRALPPGAGHAALQRADELIAKYAHLAAENSPTEDRDHQASPTKPSE